jgi:hypothetical protein
VGQNASQRFLRESGRLVPECGVLESEQLTGQRPDIHALAKRREHQLDLFQPMQKIKPKFASLNELVEVLVRCSNDTNVPNVDEGFLGTRPQPLESSRLQDAEEGLLKVGR